MNTLVPPDDRVPLADCWRVALQHPDGTMVAVVLDPWTASVDVGRATALCAGLVRQARAAACPGPRWYHEDDAAVWLGPGGSVAGTGDAGLWPGLLVDLEAGLREGAAVPSKAPGEGVYVLCPLLAGVGGEA